MVKNSHLHSKQYDRFYSISGRVRWQERNHLFVGPENREAGRSNDGGT